MNGTELIQAKVARVHTVLKFGYGLVALVVGFDKLSKMHLIVEWEKYVNPTILGMLPINIAQFLLIVGVVEIIVGALILWPKTTKLGAYVVMIWLLIIAAELVHMGLFYDIAARDVLLALGAWSLAQLSE